jgi:hypothetical protein
MADGHRFAIMKKLQHIQVTAFREPLRTYGRDTKGTEEYPVPSPSVAEIAELPDCCSVLISYKHVT